MASFPRAARRTVSLVVGVVALTGLVSSVQHCNSALDTTRQPSDANNTVGEEVFRVMCERVSVADDPGDVTFARSRPFCTGTVAVDPTLGVSATAPRVWTMALWRPPLVDALDRTFVPSLYSRTDNLLVQLLPLYGPDGNPMVSTVILPDGGRAPAEDLLPQTTRAAARLFSAMAHDDDATAVLSRFSGHQGYRPAPVALGLTRQLLSFPQLGGLLDNMLALVRDANGTRPAGAANAPMNAALDVLRGELATAAPTTGTNPQIGTTLDAALDLVYRTDPALGSGRARPIVLRDVRAMAQVHRPSGTSVPAPFVDADSDGLADASAGRFVGADGSPLAVATPFAAGDGATDGPRDALGRALADDGATPLYDYLDLDTTVLGAVLRDGATLVDPSTNALLRFARGSGVLLGTRGASSQNYMLSTVCAGAPQNVPPRCSELATGCPSACALPPVSFQGFQTATGAPLLDSIHGLGLALTSSDIDPILSTADQLMATQEGALARSLAAMLAIKLVSDTTAGAAINPRSNLWDDVMDVARRIAAEPGLLEDVLTALADPNSAQVGHALGRYVNYRDRIQPDWTSTTTQNQSLAGVHLTQRVDTAMPDTVDLAHLGSTADNRSIFQRFLHLVADLNGVRICNKAGARIVLNGVPLLGWPLTGSYNECSLIQINNAAVLFVQAIAGTAQIRIMDNGLLGWLSNPANVLIPSAARTLDGLIESQSHITGFRTGTITGRPITPEGVARLVFQPDSLHTDFINGLLGPVFTRDAQFVAAGARTPYDVRAVHPGTLFALELDDGTGHNTYDRLRPLAQAFVGHGDAGAQLFVDLLTAMHNHYPSAASGQFQSGSATAPFYAQQDGVRGYEPIISEALNGDLLVAANSLVTALPGIDAGGGRNGREAIAALVRVLLVPTAIDNIAYRDGRTTTVRSDGTTPVTAPNLYYVLADAFQQLDDTLAANPDRRDDWAAGRSALYDLFLSVDGAPAPTAQLHNRRALVIGRIALSWLRARITAHRAAGDLSTWARTTGNRLGETVSGPSFASVYQLLMALYDDTPTRQSTAQLLSFLMDDSTPDPNNAFGTTLSALGDTVQLLRADTELVPLLHALAPAFQRAVQATPSAAREELIPVTLRLLDRTRTYDTTRVLDDILRNLVQRPDEGSTFPDEALVTVGNTVAEVNRVNPGVGGPMSAADFGQVFTRVQSFFEDPQRGMEQFYFIVQHRRLGTQ